MRKHRRGHERRVLERDAVVNLVALAQAAQDADGVGDRRLGDQNRLEAPLQGGILLDMLAILVQRRCPDRVELAARQHRLEHVRRVDRSLGGAGAHDRVELVDEEDNLAVRVDDLLQHCLQPIFELASVLRAGDEGTHVQADDPPVLESFGDVAPHDALGEPFDDRGFPNARLADEHRVVLRAPRQDLDHTADLFVTADHRIQLVLAGIVGQVASVALECLVFPLGVLVGDPLGPADRGERVENPVPGDGASFQKCRARKAITLVGERDE